MTIKELGDYLEAVTGENVDISITQKVLDLIADWREMHARIDGTVKVLEPHMDATSRAVCNVMQRTLANLKCKDE